MFDFSSALPKKTLPDGSSLLTKEEWEEWGCAEEDECYEHLLKLLEEGDKIDDIFDIPVVPALPADWDIPEDDIYVEELIKKVEKENRNELSDD